MSQENEVETTGHVWDGDLQEYNNPLPRWWIWGFYASVAFAIVYWFIYPSWPVAGHFLTGFDTVTYVNNKGEKKTVHWNSRAELMANMNQYAAKQKPYFDKIAATPFKKIKADPGLNDFIASSGRTLFADNCAACHQAGGQGKIGFAPNLTDDDWLHGGTYKAIQQSIVNGREGVMPAKGLDPNMTDKQATALANYVLSLSGEPHDATLVAQGSALFHGAAGCFSCHGANAKGNQLIGSANLTDKIWLWANVPGAQTKAAKVEAVKQVILTGINDPNSIHKGVMPAWKGRLSGEQIKVLTAYVHDTLGGGE